MAKTKSQKGLFQGANRNCLPFSIFMVEKKFTLVICLVICFSKFSHQDEDFRSDCTAKLIGKNVQFEYKFKGFESYWLTHQSDGHWRPKVLWSHVKDVVKPENGFTWRIYYCGEDQTSNETVACLESLYPKWERYFIHGRELKYIATDDGLIEDSKFHYRLLCKSCDHASNCEILQVDEDCKFFIDYKFLRGNEAYCGNETTQTDDYYRWHINFDGKVNGDETVTIDEISNCSPGGQTLTKSVEFEEGTIQTNTESHSHSIESGLEAIPGFKFFVELSARLKISQKNEWSKISQSSIQTRKRSIISVPVLAGQVATVWQSILHFGNLEIKSAANYTTSNCPDMDSSANLLATDKVKILSRIENCGSSSPKRGPSVFFKQGIVNKNVNWHLNLVPLPADPSLISTLEEAIQSSSDLSHKDEWLEMDLSDQLSQYQKSVEFTGSEGVEIPPGSVMSVNQLVLYYGKYTAYSGNVWYDLVACPNRDFQTTGNGSHHSSSRQTSIWIAIGVIGGIALIALIVLLWRYRHKITRKSRNVYDISSGPIFPMGQNSSSQLSLTGSNTSYRPDFENRKNMLGSSGDPPSYHSFMVPS